MLPDQMAVGVACGAEAILHATREWLASNRHQPDCVLLQTDISNVFNTFLPAQFLQDAATCAPASARFAEYCYGTPSRLAYQGESMECARGQQGCPLMAPLFCLSHCRLVEEARRNNPRPPPGFSPAFADDSVSGGSVDEVWEQFRQELQLADAYGLHVDPRKCTLYSLAGERFRGDVSRFQSLGTVWSRARMSSCSKRPSVRIRISSNPSRKRNRERWRNYFMHWNVCLMHMWHSVCFGTGSLITRLNIGVVLCHVDNYEFY